MSNFKEFAVALHKQFDRMSKHELYRVNLDGQTVWDVYLDTYPAGTNEIYRVRRYYDGSYDRNVIRQIGNVVAVIGGKVVTVWDIPNLPEPFSVVASHLSKMVRNSTLSGLFRIKADKLGYVTTTERLEDGSIKTWEHFHVNIAERHRTDRPDEEIGNALTTIQMFMRAAEELEDSALDTVIELIEEDALYRGSEFLNSVIGFRDLKNKYLSSDKPDVFLWDQVAHSHHARFRNSVIGTLVTDLSNGVELERAVASFEAKVAPTNYKRPTALITQGMIKEAMKTIEKMDLEESLQRRYAELSDVSVNNVIWVNSDAATKMKGGVEELLQSAVKEKAPSSDKAEDIGIEDFIRNVLPKAGNMEIFFEGNMQNNLVSLTTAVNEDSPGLFKWDNNFGWSYNGEITDSITERVKSAGGKIDVPLRVSLAWFNYDDLDLHAECPDGHIYYGMKRDILDVDMNVSPTTREPVENLSWTNPRSGEYEIKVHCYTKRESTNHGFDIQIVNDGEVINASYQKNVRSRDIVDVATFTMRNGKIVDLKLSPEMSSSKISQEIWGINTQQWVKVDLMMLSPNYWGQNQTGNKHWFFMVKDCKNPEPTRGIYNEFLMGSLDKHRKVFEVLGSKTRCPESDEQLSGLGFSSTRKNAVLVRVTGSKVNRIYNLNF